MTNKNGSCLKTLVGGLLSRRGQAVLVTGDAVEKTTH